MNGRTARELLLWRKKRRLTLLAVGTLVVAAALFGGTSLASRTLVINDLYLYPLSPTSKRMVFEHKGEGGTVTLIRFRGENFVVKDVLASRAIGAPNPSCGMVTHPRFKHLGPWVRCTVELKKGSRFVLDVSTEGAGTKGNYDLNGGFGGDESYSPSFTLNQVARAPVRGTVKFERPRAGRLRITTVNTGFAAWGAIRYRFRSQRGPMIRRVASFKVVVPRTPASHSSADVAKADRTDCEVTVRTESGGSAATTTVESIYCDEPGFWGFHGSTLILEMFIFLGRGYESLAKTETTHVKVAGRWIPIGDR